MRFFIRVPRRVVGLATVALLVSPVGLTAQSLRVDRNGDSLALSIDDALRRLSSRHPALALARGRSAIAEAARAESRSVVRNQFVPLASASFASQRVAQNQFAAIARRAGSGVPAPDAADPFTQVFAASNTRTATLTASVRPFDGGVAQARAGAATHAVTAAALDEVQTRAMLEVAVVEQYADVQLYRRLLQVADSAVAQAERTRRIAQQAFETGRGPAFEVWRADAALAAQRPAHSDALRQVELAELGLRQLLELPPDTPLRLVSPAESWALSTATVRMSADSAGPNSAGLGSARIALRAADAREREAQAYRHAAQRALLPVVEVALQHQQFAYPLRGSTWGGPFFPNTTIAVSVALPLDFTGGSASRIQAATAALRVAQAQRRDAKQAHERETLDIALTLASAAEAWQAAMTGASSAEQAYQAAMTRYEVGRSSLLELQDARLAWQQAMAQRARAARDRTVADARAARLDRLPLTSLER